MSDCLFCKIVAGEIPSNKVYEDEQCFAFYDIDPQAPTHFLVIPKAHIASAAEVTAENSGAVAHIFEVIAKVARELGLDSYRIVSNIGEQAGKFGRSGTPEREETDPVETLDRTSVKRDEILLGGSFLWGKLGGSRLWGQQKGAE